jgi:hypothetical protein
MGCEETIMGMQTASKLTHQDLWPLEEYDLKRNQFRSQVMNHKKDRQVALNDNMRLYFEDRMTVQYQIQEMLRIEKLFRKNEIQDELDAYNPLIPDGSNFKATFMIEFDDPEQRKTALKQLRGVEKYLYLTITDADGSVDRISAIADEDLERENDEKTSAVHFVRFELSSKLVAAIKAGADIGFIVDHPAAQVLLPAIPDNVRQSLANDLLQVD